jgi:hypothetical protein
VQYERFVDVSHPFSIKCQISNEILEVPGNIQEGRTDATSTLNNLSSATTGQASASAAAPPFNAEEMDEYQMFAAEMFDPSTFDGFLDSSSVDGQSFVHCLWEGFPCGG